MKEKLFGWKHVMSFTFVQLLKTPSLIFLMVLLLVAGGAASFLNGRVLYGDEVKVETSIKTLLIYDGTGLNTGKWLDLKAMEFNGVLPGEVKYTDQDDEALEKMLSVEGYDDTAAVSIVYSAEDSAFRITGYYGGKGNVKESDVKDITSLITSNFKNQMIVAMDVTQEQLDYIRDEVVTEIAYYNVDDDGKASIEEEEVKAPGLGMAEYMIALIVVMLITFMVSLSGEQIATSVAQEKASRVVEYLLTSVRPLALLVGKIIAVFFITLIQAALFAFGFIAGGVALLLMHPGSNVGISDILGRSVNFSGLAQEGSSISLNFAALPIAGLIILFGILFYCVLAALAGACVGRMEELTDGMKLFTLVMVLGAYGALGVIMANMMGGISDALKMTVMVVPLTAPFIAPAYVLTGQISMLQGAISLGSMCVFLVLLAIFASGAYETLIYHNGSNIKLGQLIKIGFTGRKEASGEK